MSLLPKPSRQQTNGPVGGLRSRLGPDTHVECKRLRPEATGKQPAETLGKTRQGCCMCVHIQNTHTRAHVCVCSRWWLEPSLVWQRSAGSNCTNHSNSSGLKRRANHGEGHKLLFLLTKYGSGWLWVSCTQITLENFSVERFSTSTRLLDAVRALQGETNRASSAYGVRESTSPSNISAKKFKNE